MREGRHCGVHAARADLVAPAIRVPLRIGGTLSPGRMPPRRFIRGSSAYGGLLPNSRDGGADNARRVQSAKERSALLLRASASIGVARRRAVYRKTVRTVTVYQAVTVRTRARDDQRVPPPYGWELETLELPVGELLPETRLAADRAWSVALGARRACSRTRGASASARLR